MNRQPPNYRQTTANAVNRQTANRLYIKGGGGGGSGSAATASQQTTLPGVRDWREPVTCQCPDLPRTLAEAASAGYLVRRVERLRHNSGYKLFCEAMPAATDSRGARAIEPLEDSNHFATKTQPLPTPPHPKTKAIKNLNDIGSYGTAKLCDECQNKSALHENWTD